VDRPGPSYTVDTLTALKKQRGSAETFFFILGGDTLADLPLWKEPEKLMQLCRFGVAPRSSSGMNLHSLEASLPGVMKNIIPINMPLIETSSSDIRQRVARGLPIRYLVPDEVERYITEQKLYSEGKYIKRPGFSHFGRGAG
jgi:nicotinate-nucleotide adenylyltransferase